MAIPDLDLNQLQSLRQHLRAQRNMMPLADRGQAPDIAIKARIDSVEARISAFHGAAADEIEAKTGPDIRES